MSTSYLVIDTHTQIDTTKPLGAFDIIGLEFDEAAARARCVQKDQAYIPLEPAVRASWPLATFPRRAAGSEPTSGPIPSDPSRLDRRRWAPSLVAGADLPWPIGFKPGMRRVFAGTTPSGQPALEVRCPKGICDLNSFETAPFGDRGVDVAEASCDIFLEPGFSWGTSQGKLGLGMYGGTGPYSGGVSLAAQKGFSLRINRSRNGKLELYSYHLNRGGTPDANGKLFGAVESSNIALPTGQSVKLTLQMKLNALGDNDGWAKLLVDGKLVAAMHGLVYRESDIGILGLLFTDMWGGTEEDEKNFSPREQRYWYSGFAVSEL